MLQELAELILPQGLLKYFTITSIETEVYDTEERPRGLYIGIEENNELRTHYSHNEYNSKGLVRARIVQDFPVRGQPLYLIITRRRWQHKDSKKLLQNDYTLIAEGSRITKEFSDFLKSGN